MHRLGARLGCVPSLAGFIVCAILPFVSAVEDGVIWTASELAGRWNSHVACVLCQLCVPCQMQLFLTSKENQAMVRRVFKMVTDQLHDSLFLKGWRVRPGSQGSASRRTRGQSELVQDEVEMRLTLNRRCRSIIVVDTWNQAVREINIESRRVRTLVDAQKRETDNLQGV